MFTTPFSSARTILVIAFICLLFVGVARAREYQATAKSARVFVKRLERFCSLKTDAITFLLVPGMQADSAVNFTYHVNAKLPNSLAKALTGNLVSENDHLLAMRLPVPRDMAQEETASQINAILDTAYGTESSNHADVLYGHSNGASSLLVARSLDGRNEQPELSAQAVPALTIIDAPFHRLEQAITHKVNALRLSRIPNSYAFAKKYAPKILSMTKHEFDGVAPEDVAANFPSGHPTLLVAREKDRNCHQMGVKKLYQIMKNAGKLVYFVELSGANHYELAAGHQNFRSAVYSILKHSLPEQKRHHLEKWKEVAGAEELTLESLQPDFPEALEFKVEEVPPSP